MSEMNLTLKLTTEGGKVVVRDISDIADATEQANQRLDETGKAGSSARKGLDDTSKSTRELDTHMAGLYRSLGLVAGALGVFGVGAFFKGVITESEQLQRNLLRTQAVIDATGQAAGFSAQQLHSQARELALSTLQSTEGVMQAQQVLLSYSNITGDIFTRAIETATDLSTLIGGNLNSSLEMLAKTLDNPIEGINAMRRQGIYFSESQQRVIKSLIDTNRLAEAQGMILDELAGQFGGIARKEAEGLSGAFDTLGQALQETKLAMGEQLAINQALATTINTLASGVFRFNAALESGELRPYVQGLKLAATATAALLAAKYGAAAASAVWVRAKAASTAASAAFAAQNARTLRSLLNLRDAANLTAAAFIGWEIGSYLRAEFAVVERAGIALAAGIHKSLVRIGGQFDVLAESFKYALTHPLDFAREKLIDYLQWLLSLGGRTLSLLGFDGVFDELDGKLDGYRAKTSAEHQAALATIRENTANELKQMDAIYGEMFASVATGAERTAKAVADIPAPTPDLTPFNEEIDHFNKALLALYNSHKLNAEAVDEHGRALTGIDLELFKAQFVEASELPADAEAAIRSFVQTAQAAASVTAADKALSNLRKETELLKIRLAQGEQEYEIQKALYQLKGGDPAVLAAIEAELRLQQELNQVIADTEEIASAAWGQMLDDMTALSSAGNAMGDILTQAFGRVAQQIDAMTGHQMRYNAALKQLAAEKARIAAMPEGAERTAAEIKHQQTLARLQRENAQAQLGHFASISGAAKNMFSEQSKGREALHRMETVFTAAELAMSLKKSSANALEAITSAFAAPFPLNFASGAAMMAIMAGLGVFSGSSSGNPNLAADRQASQGTGTVLGSDDKSESIANTLDRIEALELDQYNELRAINQSIKALNQGIAQLAVNLVRSFGRFDAASYGGPLGTDKKFQLGSGLSSVVAGGTIGLGLDKLLLDGLIGNIFNSIIGGISKTTRSLVDSGLSFEAQQLGDIIATGILEGSYYNVIETTKRKLWGLSKKRSQDTEYTALDNALQQEFGRIFGFIGDSVQQAVDLLGIETSRVLENFVINLPALSFNEMSGDDIQKELEAIFSQQADLMVQYLVPSMAEYQKMGEGLYDTLMRVAQEQAIFNAQLDALGLQLGDLSAALRIEVAQSIIELMGGVEQFRDLTGQYFSVFYDETEQFEFLSRSLGQAFADLGMAMPDARDSFRELVDGLDLTTEAGQQLFAQLMQLVPGLDEYFKAMDRQADAAEKAAAAERRLAEQRMAFSAGFESELSRLDMTELERSLDSLQGWYSEQIAIAEELGAETVFLERLYARKRSDILNAELDRLNSDFERLVSSLQSASTSISNAIVDIRRSMAGWDEAGYQSSQVDSVRGRLGQGDVAEQIKTVEELRAAIVNRYSAEQAAIDSLAAQQQSVIDALKSSYEQLVSSIQSAAASIASSMLDIQRQGAGWDEVGYQTGQINDLRSQLGLGSTADQVNTITQLQQAITGRYQAEVAANRKLQDAANQRYQTELAASQAMRQAAQQLLQAADAMLLSNLSPDLLGTQLTEAKSQFDTLLAAARGGDADAARQLQQVGSSYLNIAKDYYAQGSDEYAAIFNEIQSAYRGVAAGAPGEPPVPAAVLNYQRVDAQLQQQAIDELTGLQELLAELEAQAAAEQAQQLAEAEAALASYRTDSLALQQATIDELTGLQALLEELEEQAANELAVQTNALTEALHSTADRLADAIAAIPAPVIVVPPVPVAVDTPKSDPVVSKTMPDSNVALIDELKKQREESQQQNAQLVRELTRVRTELYRSQELLYGERRIV